MAAALSPVGSQDSLGESSEVDVSAFRLLVGSPVGPCKGKAGEVGTLPTLSLIELLC